MQTLAKRRELTLPALPIQQSDVVVVAGTRGDDGLCGLQHHCHGPYAQVGGNNMQHAQLHQCLVVVKHHLKDITLWSHAVYTVRIVNKGFS